LLLQILFREHQETKKELQTSAINETSNTLGEAMYGFLSSMKTGIRTHNGQHGKPFLQSLMIKNTPLSLESDFKGTLCHFSDVSGAKQSSQKP